MYFLKNNVLTAAILDPVADAARLSSRYCTAGYIWQVRDAQGRDLLTGPAYPDPNPLPFHGQGIPDAFFTMLGADQCLPGGDVMVVGVGKVKRISPELPFQPRVNQTVQQICAWQTEVTATRIIQKTRQAFLDWNLELTRTVSLEGNCLRSITSLYNAGAPLPLKWFAHPFFPHTADRSCAAFSRPVSVAANPAYYFDEAGKLRIKAEHPLERDVFQILDLEAGKPLTLTVLHPITGTVRIECPFPVAWLPVWFNENTFSPEPFLEVNVKPSVIRDWEISYTFGL
jgi:hypothetical protein